MKRKLIVLIFAMTAGSFFYGCGAEEPAKAPLQAEEPAETPRQVERPSPTDTVSTPEPAKVLPRNVKKAEKILELVEKLEGDDEKAAHDAALQLALVGDETAVEPLIDMSERETGSLRVAAIKALGSIADRRAFDILLAALGDRSVDLRRIAASSLGDFRDEAAIEPLIEALQDEDKWVRIDARHSLKKLTNQDFKDYNAWSQWNVER